MAKFNYKALQNNGKTIDGSLEATSRANVISILQKQNLKPLTIEEIGGKKGSLDLSSLTIGKPVKLADLVVFTRQLSTMVSAGVRSLRPKHTSETIRKQGFPKNNRQNNQGCRGRHAIG